ncbi:MAG: phospholipase D-like domain-containing protein [Pseudomonadota bacterium]
MFPIPIPSLTPLLEAVALAFYVLLAGLVTVNILLKKSDVPRALGWIGLVWLTPIFGGLLYYLFGINRVERRALKMRWLDARAGGPGTACPETPDNIALLCNASGRVTGEPLTAGNAMTVLDSGDEAYGVMLEAIRAARHCIGMTSYIFRDDDAGQEFADALIEASRRGVKVRVLVDSVGAGYFFTPILHRLHAGGVPCERFLHTWLPWRMPFLNMRNHRKVLVVDGRIAFTGGMNIGIENSKARFGPKAILDTHFRIEGPVVRVIMDAFARDWTFTNEEPLDDPCWWPPLAPVGEVFARGVRSGPDADIYKSEMILGAALSLARKRIRIVTPYFLPDPRLQFAIAQAGMRGVEVQIVIPAKSDQLVMDWAMRGHLRFFLHIKACIIATPEPFDHSKLCTVDGEWSWIGSSNWDARSLRLNFELDVECVDQDLTGRLDAMIDEKIRRGKRLEPECLARERVWLRLRNAAARMLMPYL